MSARGVVGNPVCAFHGKTAEEHEYGRCLYCCLCFKTLTPADCWEDENGVKWDVCVPCREAELAAVPLSVTADQEANDRG